jgi:hypothetical protein
MWEGGDSNRQVESRSHERQGGVRRIEGAAQPDLFKGCQDCRCFGADPAPEPEQVTTQRGDRLSPRFSKKGTLHENHKEDQIAPPAEACRPVAEHENDPSDRQDEVGQGALAVGLRPSRMGMGSWALE